MSSIGRTAPWSTPSSGIVGALGRGQTAVHGTDDATRHRCPRGRRLGRRGPALREIAGWATPIIASSIDAAAPDVGATRTCHIQGVGPFRAGLVRERLLHHDDAARRLVYEAVEGLPAYVTRSVNPWSVLALADDRCAVHIHATLTLSGPVRWLGPLLRARMRGDSVAVLGDLEPLGREPAVVHARRNPTKISKK